MSHCCEESESIKANVIIDDGQARSAGTKEATGANGRVRCAAADAAYPGSCSNIIDPFSPIQFNSINLIIQISSCRGSRQPAPPIFFHHLSFSSVLSFAAYCFCAVCALDDVSFPPGWSLGQPTA